MIIAPPTPHSLVSPVITLPAWMVGILKSLLQTLISIFILEYLAHNLCKEIGTGHWRVYNWWQAISPCFSKEWGVGDIDTSLCMKSPSHEYQEKVDWAVVDFNMVGLGLDYRNINK